MESSPRLQAWGSHDVHRPEQQEEVNEDVAVYQGRHRRRPSGSARSRRSRNRRAQRSSVQVLGWQPEPHQPKDVSHLISSDSDSGAEQQSHATSRQHSQPSTNTAPVIVSTRYSLPAKYRTSQSQNTTDVSHLISDDSEESDSEPSIPTNQAMRTTQEFLVQANGAQQTHPDGYQDPEDYAIHPETSVGGSNAPTPNRHHHSNAGEAAGAAEGDEHTPLPPGWYRYYDKDGFPYYYNEETGVSSWDLVIGDSSQHEGTASAAASANVANASTEPASGVDANVNVHQLQEEVKSLRHQLAARDTYSGGTESRTHNDNIDALAAGWPVLQNAIADCRHKARLLAQIEQLLLSGDTEQACSVASTVNQL